MNQNIYTVDEIKEKLLTIFESEPVFTAILFGSYANGEATKDSDVDIVIDSFGELLNMNFYGVLHDITEALDKRVDLMEASEISKDSPLLDEIEKRGVLLYEKAR